MSDTKEKVKSFIVENFLFGEVGDLNDNTSLLDEGIIDSQGILELVFFIENELDIEVGDEELVPDNLDSLNKIEAFIKNKSACAA